MHHIPNMLTGLRILMIPAVLMLINNESIQQAFVAGLVFGLAALTDFVDGYWARKRELISVLGQFLDPLADKILVMGTLVWMVSLDRVAAWVVIVLLSREMAISGLRAIASAQGLVIEARSLGKDKTALQLVGIYFLIVHFDYPLLGTNLVFSAHQVGLYFLYASLVFSLLSAIDYAALFVRAGRTNDPARDDLEGA